MSAPNETRLWFVTDVRGSSDVFGKVLNVVRHHPDVAKKPDVVLLSGDLTGGELCVVGVDTHGKAYAEFRGERCPFDSEAQRDLWAAAIEQTLGGYIVEDTVRRTVSLDELRIRRLRKWLDLVNRTQSGQGARFLIVPGPNEPPDIETILSGIPGIEVCDNRAVEVNSELMLACSSALAYPEAIDTRRQPRHYHPDRASYVAHVEEIMARPGTPKPNGKWLFNLYMPPKNTILDLCTQLDANGVPVLGPSGPELCNTGSEAVRDCIEKFAPVASLHSYPPFDYRTQKISGTRLIAPGTEAYAGYAVGAWLIFSGKHLTAWEPTREEIIPDHWNVLLNASESAMAVLVKKPLDIVNLYRKPVEDAVTRKSRRNRSAKGQP